MNRLRNLWNYRELIVQFTIRDLMSRYKGSYLGVAWAIINPLVMLLVYSFIFVVIFQMRWGAELEQDKLLYTLMIFSGLVPFYIFSESVNRSITAVSSNPNYVKKVVIPLEILPLSLVLSVVINNLFGLGLLILGKLIFLNTPDWSLIYVPLLLLPITILSLGLALMLSALGVYLRDLAHSISLVVNILFYMSPIFYSADIVPAPFDKIITLNPLTGIIEQWREVILLGNQLVLRDYLWVVSFSVLIFFIGYSVFLKLRKGFADVV